MNSNRIASQAVRTLVVSALIVNSLVVGTSQAAASTRIDRPEAVDTTPAPTTETAAATFGSLPLAFEPNRGQVDPSVRYVARGTAATLFVTDTELVTVAGESVVRMGFPRARRVTASDELPGKANYIIDNDPSKWHTDVPLYERTTLEAVFPGIDLVVYGTNGAPEYDFVVAPGADPSAIRVTMDGARSMRIDDGGDLVLDTAGGELRHNRPVLYQTAADGSRQPVSGAFSLMRGQLGFRVGTYDRTRPLVIDPVLRFSTYLGGKKTDLPSDVAVDAAGNVYVVGITNSRDFPLKNPYESYAFSEDIFVTKLNPNGTALVFSTLIGGSDADSGLGIDVDSAGRVFIGGSSASLTYPMKNQYSIPTPFTNTQFEAVLTVLTSAGNALVYSTVIGGYRDDEAFDVAVDIHGNAFIAGYANSERFPTKSPSDLPPFQSEPGGGGVLNPSDGFVAKFDPDESGETSLVYSTLIGGSDADIVESVRVDQFERAYVAGRTLSRDFPVANALQPTSGGGVDAFVTKFNADGTTVFYSTYLGGAGDEEGFNVAIDELTGGDPEACIVGFTDSADFPVLNAAQPTFNGGTFDAFVSKLTGDGRQLVYSTYLGGEGTDKGRGIEADTFGNVVVCGSGTNGFPLRDPVLINGAEIGKGLFVSKLAKDGSLVLSTFIGDAEGTNVAIDANGDAYVVGTTSSTVFPVTPGVFQPTLRGDQEGVVLKLDIIDDDTIGVWNPTTRTFLARNTNLPGAAELTVQFGVSGDRPLSGDWNGDGIDTVGVYTPSQGRFSLRNTNTAGAADLSFVFGAPNQQAIKGDWNGDGVDTIGVFDPATNSYFLRNSNSAGAADFVFSFGVGGQGAVAIAGDWNGDGVDTVGFYVPSTGEFFLINANAGGNADLQFVFGPTNAVPVAGDWNADTIDTVGVVIVDPADGRKLRFLLTNANAAGPEALSVQFGNVGELAVVGNWDGQ